MGRAVLDGVEQFYSWDRILVFIEYEAGGPQSQSGQFWRREKSPFPAGV